MIQFFVTYRVSHSSPFQSAPLQTTYVQADEESGVRAALVESLPFTSPDAIQIESIENQGEADQPTSLVSAELSNKRTVKCDYCEKKCPPGTAVAKYGNTSRRKFFLCVECAWGVKPAQQGETQNG